MNIGNRIKSLRLDCLLSQIEFANELGVSFSTVNRWETGKAKPSLKALKAIDMFCKNHKMDFDIRKLKE